MDDGDDFLICIHIRIYIYIYSIYTHGQSLGMTQMVFSNRLLLFIVRAILRKISNIDQLYEYFQLG